MVDLTVWVSDAHGDKDVSEGHRVRLQNKPRGLQPDRTLHGGVRGVIHGQVDLWAQDQDELGHWITS